MQVTRSSFYNWRKSQSNTDHDPDNELLDLIRDLRKNKRYLCYGSRRLKRFLQDLGVIVSRKKLRRLMKHHNIKVRQKRSYRPRTTDSRHNLPVAANRLGRDFASNAADRKWAGDITYLRCGSGFAYLAVVMDLYSRKIIGWSVSTSLHTKLVIDALNMALIMRGKPNGVIFHSDRGSQYASGSYRQLLQVHGLTASMSRKGDCWDNSPVESFFATLKKEAELHGSMNFDQIRREVFEYIAVFYNRQRSHSYLDGMSPENFELNNHPLTNCA